MGDSSSSALSSPLTVGLGFGTESFGAKQRSSRHGGVHRASWGYTHRPVARSDRNSGVLGSGLLVSRGRACLGLIKVLGHRWSALAGSSDHASHQVRRRARLEPLTSQTRVVPLVSLLVSARPVTDHMARLRL